MPDILTQPEVTVRGKIRDRDDDWLLLLALLSLADVSAAGEWWGEIAQPAYKSLLTKPTFTYEPDAMQWVRRGSPVPHQAVKGAIVAAVTNAEVEAARITGLMVVGKIKLQEWFDMMAKIIKQTATAVAMVARGIQSPKALSMPPGEISRTAEVLPTDPAQAKSTGDVVAYQMDRLHRFAEQIKAGAERADTVEIIETRAKLYPRQAITLYEQGRQREAVAAGVTEERNVLGIAEHCYSAKDELVIGCKNVTEAGWQPVGTLPGPGLRKCKANCKCRLEFRRDGKIIGITQ